MPYIDSKKLGAKVFGKVRLLFGGSHALNIPGFSIRQSFNDWDIAIQGDKQFFISTAMGGFRLLPKDYQGRCRTDKAIFIPFP